MPNKFLQSDQIVLSCLLQKAQKPRQHALADEERRYGSVILRLPYRIMELHTIYKYLPFKYAEELTYSGTLKRGNPLPLLKTKDIHIRKRVD